MGLTERLARACAARPRRTLAFWGVAVLVAIVLIVTALHGLSSQGNVEGNPESTKAKDTIARAFPGVAAREKQDVIVVTSSRYTVDSPQFRAFGKRLGSSLRATGEVRDARPVARSPDGHSALVSVHIGSDSGAGPVEKALEELNGGAFQVGITGFHSTGYDFGRQSQTDLEKGELAFGLPAALIVLVLVFGAVVAGLVPVLMAILSIIVALGLVAVISLEFSLSVFIVNMLTGMGLALGIDYSLFVVSRYREERGHGLAKEEAIARTGATASRAVLFSGSTFVVALLGMFIVPTSIMRSLALGAILVGIVSVAAALSLLPALLSLVGDRVNSWRVPYLGRNLGRADTAEGRFWKRIVDAVLRRPALSLAVSVGAMLLLASPIFGLHIGANGVSTLPSSLPSKQGYVLLQRAFPVQNPEPVRIVAVGGDAAAVRRDLVRLNRRLASEGSFGTGTVQTSAKGVALLTSPVRGDPVGGAAVSAVRDLRANVIPSIFAGTDAKVYVGGVTAENVDYFDAVTNPTPYVLLFVLGLSFILLTVAFRSIVVALVSVLLNLLSVGAAYGLLTLVFLDGHGAGLFGFQHTHVIDAWVPLFLFSVLFGLSMDYQVFLMSRIKERYDQSGSTHDAVVGGVASTARIITGAALIIVVVFAGFAAGKLVMFQQMGFGVAIALLLDATIIRSVVLPATLALLDRRSWYLPRWLEWIPHVEVEAPAVADL
ncbi:MAG TPA: MMPL family transporter [Gaiellaceae bacterium]|jgi:putative drug exporter of the RND superfamily|nr:MMPL family transporter [Gaiellaceae bacterium]